MNARSFLHAHRHVLLGAFLWVTSALTASASVWLSTNTTPLSQRPKIFTDEVMTGVHYRLRAKFNNVAGYPTGFHAATTEYNQGLPLDALPPPGIYSVDLYWVKYDAAGNPTTGPMQNVTVAVTASGVTLSASSFAVSQP